MIWIVWQLAVFISVWLSTKHSIKLGRIIAIIWTIESIAFLWFMSPLQILQLIVVWVTYFYFKKYYHNQYICSNCYKEVNCDSNFCKYCGNKVEGLK